MCFATTSVVGSDGQSLEIETTSLATLAWLREPSFAANVERAIHYLADSCDAGRYGSTAIHPAGGAATIVAYDKSPHTQPPREQFNWCSMASRLETRSPSTPTRTGPFNCLTSPVNFRRANMKLPCQDVGRLFAAVRVNVTFNSLTPASSDQCKLRLETSLKDSQITEGSPSEVHVTVSNITTKRSLRRLRLSACPAGLKFGTTS